MLKTTTPVPGLNYSNVFRGTSFDVLWGGLDSNSKI